MTSFPRGSVAERRSNDKANPTVTVGVSEALDGSMMGLRCRKTVRWLEELLEDMLVP